MGEKQNQRKEDMVAEMMVVIGIEVIEVITIDGKEIDQDIDQGHQSLEYQMINHVQEAHQRVEIVKEKGSQIDHVRLHDTNQAETECHPDQEAVHRRSLDN